VNPRNNILSFGSITKRMAQLWRHASETEMQSLIVERNASTSAISSDTTMINALSPTANIFDYNTDTIDSEEIKIPLRTFWKSLDEWGYFFIPRSPSQESQTTFTPMQMSIRRRALTTTVYVISGNESYLFTMQKSPGYLPIQSPVFNYVINGKAFDYLDLNSVFSFLSSSKKCFESMTALYFDKTKLRDFWDLKKSNYIDVLIEDTENLVSKEANNHSIFSRGAYRSYAIITLTFVAGITCIAADLLTLKEPDEKLTAIAQNTWQNFYNNCTDITVTCGGAFRFPLIQNSCTWGIPITEMACIEGPYNNNDLAITCKEMVSLGCDLAECLAQQDDCRNAIVATEKYVILLVIGVTLLASSTILGLTTALFVCRNSRSRQREYMYDNNFLEFIEKNMGNNAKEFIVALNQNPNIRFHNIRDSLTILRGINDSLIETIKQKITSHPAETKHYARKILSTYSPTLYKSACIADPKKTRMSHALANSKTFTP
jgi:hypothetical protein